MKISMPLATLALISSLALNLILGGWLIYRCLTPSLPPAQAGAPATSATDLPPDDPRTRHRKWKYQPQTKTVTIVGEVVDSWCYSSQVMGPGRGERHKACGLACAHGGVTIGIVDDEGTLYICAKHKAYTGCKELLTPFMAKRVKVLGWLGQKGGCNVLKIADVEEVKDGATGQAASVAPRETAPQDIQASTANPANPVAK